MGDRANYVIRESGHVELYYSHWGGLTVSEDIFWGPAKTEEFIRQNQRTTEWLDDVWAMGGIALDKDDRRLTYFYCEWPDEEDLRRVYESLLKETWQAAGWTVCLASTWQDFAAAVGIEPEFVTATPLPPNLITFDQVGENLKGLFCCGVLSLRVTEGWHDFAIDFSMAGFLMNGPSLIDRLSAVANLEELRAAFLRRRPNDSAKTLGDWIDEYCAIDPSAQTLRVSLSEDQEREIVHLEALWSGWRIVFEPGGAEGHFAYTGRDVPADLVATPKPPPPIPPDRPYAECVQLIRNHLDGTEARKAADFASHIQLVQKLNAMDGPVTVAPGFLNRVPASAPNWFERMQFAMRLKTPKRET